MHQKDISNNHSFVVFARCLLAASLQLRIWRNKICRVSYRKLESNIWNNFESSFWRSARYSYIHSDVSLTRWQCEACFPVWKTSFTWCLFNLVHQLYHQTLHPKDVYETGQHARGACKGSGPSSFRGKMYQLKWAWKKISSKSPGWTSATLVEIASSIFSSSNSPLYVCKKGSLFEKFGYCSKFFSVVNLHALFTLAWYHHRLVRIRSWRQWYDFRILYGLLWSYQKQYPIFGECIRSTCRSCLWPIKSKRCSVVMLKGRESAFRLAQEPLSFRLSTCTDEQMLRKFAFTVKFEITSCFGNVDRVSNCFCLRWAANEEIFHSAPYTISDAGVAEAGDGYGVVFFISVVSVHHIVRWNHCVSPFTPELP